MFLESLGLQRSVPVSERGLWFGFFRVIWENVVKAHEASDFGRLNKKRISCFLYISAQLTKQH